MQKKGSKLTALLLALCITLSLAACGSGGNGGGDGEKQSGDAGQLSGTIYVPKFMELGIDADYISGGCCDGKNVYISASVNRGTEEEPVSGYAIFRIPLDTGTAVELEDYEPSQTFASSEEGWFSIQDLRAGADGTIWVTEQTSAYTYDLPEDFNEETDSRWDYMTSTETQLMRQLDSTGKELKRIDITNLQETAGLMWIRGMRLDAKGNLYVSGEAGSAADGDMGSEQLVVLDPELNVLFSLEGNFWNGESALLSDGRMAVLRRNNEGSLTLTAVDLETKDWGDDYPMPAMNNSVYDGAGEYLFHYNNGESLYGYDPETGEGVRLLSWSAADINVDRLTFFSFLEDGKLVAMTQDWGMEGVETELAVLTETEASAATEKTILTYAAMRLGSDDRANIIKFNKTNSKYRIEIRDYSEYATEDDYDAGLTKLNTEILAGQVPDILAVSDLPIRQYAAKGLLEDLWPLIDSDPDISRETLMTRVFEAASKDGKLYQAFPNFAISTVAGDPKIVGDEPGWTLAELREALAKMPEGCGIFDAGDTKDMMLRNIIALNVDGYVDWETGECSFNGEQFKAALEFCNSFPLEYDWEANSDNYEDEPTRIKAGKQMLKTMTLDGFGDLQIYEAMYAGEDGIKSIPRDYGAYSSGGTAVITGTGGVSMMGENVSNRLRPGRYLTFKGFPMEDGSCGSTFTISGSALAISSTCKDKAGAWEYVRECLLPVESRKYSNGYSGWGFPSNKADFDAEAAEAMKAEYVLDSEGNQVLDDEGEPIQESKGGWSWGNSLDIDLVATSQEEYDQIMELYSMIDSISDYDDSLYEIVSDLAGSYFNGDKSLDETAELIQGRVKLYVNESK